MVDIFLQVGVIVIILVIIIYLIINIVKNNKKSELFRTGSEIKKNAEEIKIFNENLGDQHYRILLNYGVISEEDKSNFEKVNFTPDIYNTKNLIYDAIIFEKKLENSSLYDSYSVKFYPSPYAVFRNYKLKEFVRDYVKKISNDKQINFTAPPNIENLDDFDNILKTIKSLINKSSTKNRNNYIREFGIANILNSFKFILLENGGFKNLYSILSSCDIEDKTVYLKGGGQKSSKNPKLNCKEFPKIEDKNIGMMNSDEYSVYRFNIPKSELHGLDTSPYSLIYYLNMLNKQIRLIFNTWKKMKLLEQEKYKLEEKIKKKIPDEKKKFKDLYYFDNNDNTFKLKKFTVLELVGMPFDFESRISLFEVISINQFRKLKQESLEYNFISNKSINLREKRTDDPLYGVPPRYSMDGKQKRAFEDKNALAAFKIENLTSIQQLPGDTGLSGFSNLNMFLDSILPNKGRIERGFSWISKVDFIKLNEEELKISSDLWNILKFFEEIYHRFLIVSDAGNNSFSLSKLLGEFLSFRRLAFGRLKDSLLPVLFLEITKFKLLNILSKQVGTFPRVITEEEKNLCFILSILSLYNELYKIYKVEYKEFINIMDIYSTC